MCSQEQAPKESKQEALAESSLKVPSSIRYFKGRSNPVMRLLSTQFSLDCCVEEDECEVTAICSDSKFKSAISRAAPG